MQKLYKTLLILLLIPNISFASSYLLTCLNVDDQFTTNFMIDETNKTIMHLSSFDPTTKQKFIVNKFEKIIFFDNKFVGAYTMTSAGIHNFRVLNLDKMTYSNSGHYMGDVKPYGQLFECFKSN